MDQLEDLQGLTALELNERARLLCEELERIAEALAIRASTPAAELQARPTLMTVDQARAELGVSRTRLFALLSSGELESIRIGRNRRIPAAAVDQFIAALSGVA